MHPNKGPGMIKPSPLAPALSCFLALAFAIQGHANPVFFIDTPELLRNAQKAALANDPDLPEGGLVVASDALDFSCSPDEVRYRAEEAAQQCLKNPYSPSPCKATVRLMIRTTVEQQVTALAHGPCAFSTSYQGVFVDFFQDGTIEVRKPDFQFSTEEIKSCASDNRPMEISTLAAAHEKILSREVSNSEIGSKAQTFIHPDGLFFLDYGALLRNTHESIARKLSISKESGFNALRTQKWVHFQCNGSQNWNSSEQAIFDRPQHKTSASLCHASLWVTGQSSLEQLKDLKNGVPQCKLTTPETSYLVQAFSDGSAEVTSIQKKGHSEEGSCKRLTELSPSIGELISRFQNVKMLN
ncbi:hypothetical protein [Microbulbifer sp.]|uniref:hypothetical protein n=1 Tax=Microbulbifer sp. TaxID=1908541 RepID=UPI002588059B|nr:hypothetical protein [Microbulbifer sp.]